MEILEQVWLEDGKYHRKNYWENWWIFGFGVAVKFFDLVDRVGGERRGEDLKWYIWGDKEERTSFSQREEWSWYRN